MCSLYTKHVQFVHYLVDMDGLFTSEIL